MSFSIFSTDNFDKELKRLAKKYRSIKSDFKILKESLEEFPAQGEPLGKDCYKVRIAISSKGKGKSGGGRVIICVKLVADTVYLLSVFDKSEKESISDTELDFLLKKAEIL